MAVKIVEDSAVLTLDFWSKESWSLSSLTTYKKPHRCMDAE